MPHGCAPRCPASARFFGSMDYSANVDAVVHLVEDVLPRIGDREVELVVAGSNPRRQVFSAAGRAPEHIRVEVAGFVPDPAQYFERCRVFVVPLRYGVNAPEDHRGACPRRSGCQHHHRL